MSVTFGIVRPLTTLNLSPQYQAIKCDPFGSFGMLNPKYLGFDPFLGSPETIPGGEFVSRSTSGRKRVGRSLFMMGSPNSRVGRMNHKLSDHFGGMRNVPLSALALVADSKIFRINNTVLQRGLEEGFVMGKQTVHAKEKPLSWAMAIISSRFSNEDLRQAALDRYVNIAKHYWDVLNRPLSNDELAVRLYLSGRDNQLESLQRNFRSRMNKGMIPAFSLAEVLNSREPSMRSLRIFLGKE